MGRFQTLNLYIFSRVSSVLFVQTRLIIQQQSLSDDGILRLDKLSIIIIIYLQLIKWQLYGAFHRNNYLRLNSSCIIFHHFRLPGNNALQNLKNNYCVHPNGGRPGEGVHLVHWPSCDSERLKLDFFDLGENVSPETIDFQKYPGLGCSKRD